MRAVAVLRWLLFKTAPDLYPQTGAKALATRCAKRALDLKAAASVISRKYVT